MHEVAPNQLTEEIPASVKIPRHRLQYPLLPEDFFSFVRHHIGQAPNVEQVK